MTRIVLLLYFEVFFIEVVKLKCALLTLTLTNFKLVIGKLIYYYLGLTTILTYLKEKLLF